MKRGGFLKRKTPLKRTAMKRSSRKNSYARRDRDTDFMAWVRKQPCILRDPAMNETAGAHVDEAHEDYFPDLRLTGERAERWLPCNGDVEADHMGDRAMGRKATDDTCAPICRNHHDQRTNGWGVFWSWKKAWKRAFRAKAIALTQARGRAAGVLA